MNPKVSVHFITHNQELFVGKALESVLAQVTNFSFEIVIGEDASTDRTGEICDELIKKSEVPVKIFHHSENLGYLGNFMFTLEQCTGDYIALLEGDDFWTDPMKLQKQVDLLESEQQSVIAFSRVLIVDEADRILSESHDSQMPSSPGIGLLMKGNFGFTASCMFRNLFRVDAALLSLMRKYAAELPVLDYPLYLLMAERGTILFSNDILAAYRVHRHSLWNAMRARDHLDKIFRS